MSNEGNDSRRSRPTTVRDPRDLTDAEALRRSEARQSLILESVPVVIYGVPFEGGYDPTWIAGQTQRVTGFDPEELVSTPGLWASRLHPEDHDRALQEFESVRTTGYACFGYRFKCADGRYRWFQEQPVLAYDRHGKPIEITGTIVDVDAQKRAEDTQKFLLRELDHRVKNTLAAVESIAWETARSAHNPKDFARAFSGRIRAMGMIHDALARENWVGLSLRRLVHMTLSPFHDDGDGRLNLSGDPLAVSLHAIRPIGLALHELASNASRHGALSGAAGRVNVSWRAVESTAERRWLVINWAEHDGPRVNAPHRKGLGTALIEEAVPYELGGEVRLDYAPHGLRCEIAVPFPDPLGEIT